jgi:hypothetical protein
VQDVSRIKKAVTYAATALIIVGVGVYLYWPVGKGVQPKKNSNEGLPTRNA